MNHASATCALAALLSLSSVALAQSFAYPNFANVTGLSLNGSAAQSGTSLRVTNSGAVDTGSTWRTTPVSVAEGFETEFSFVISTQCEGMAFVIQGSPMGAAALGGDFWGLGYGFGNSGMGISNSIAIEIDAMQDGFLSDTSDNELSVHTVGALGNSENEGASIGRVTPNVNMSNNQAHTMKVVYAPGVPGAYGTLTVFVDDLVTPRLMMPFSFEIGSTDLFGNPVGGLGLSGPDAWVGFTAANNASGQFAEIRSWNWVSQFLPDSCYVGNVLAGAGGPYDVLSVNGSIGGFYRVERPRVAEPFTIDVAPPPGETMAPFIMTATLGLADASTVVVTPFGNACFAQNVLDIGGFLAPYTLSVPAGVVLNFDMTLQAVMATDSSDPAQIELTNAVGLSFQLGPAPTISNLTPNAGPAGTPMVLAGTGFSPNVTLLVGGATATITSLSETSIGFNMPAGVSCDSTLRVLNPDLSFADTLINPIPTIVTENNTTGSVAGNTIYVATGVGFAPGSTMTVGGVAANVLASTATSMVARTPPGTVGPAMIVITTPAGCQVTSTFTYF